MEPKFHFNDFVVITEGFYKGTSGTVIELVSPKEYKVSMDLHSMVLLYVKEDQLKLVE